MIRKTVIRGIAASMLLSSALYAAECPNGTAITADTTCTIPAGVSVTITVIGKGGDGQRANYQSAGGGGGYCRLVDYAVANELSVDMTFDATRTLFASGGNTLSANNGANGNGGSAGNIASGGTATAGGLFSGASCSTGGASGASASGYVPGGGAAGGGDANTNTQGTTNLPHAGNGGQYPTPLIGGNYGGGSASGIAANTAWGQSQPGAAGAVFIEWAAAPVITEGDTALEKTTAENTALTEFTLNATDANGDTLTWSISSPASHGTATVSNTPTGNSQAINYTPAANYNGSDSFTVQVSDATATDTIVVNVTVEAQNDAPADISLTDSSIAEGNSVGDTVGTLSATDADSGDTATFSLTCNTPGSDDSAFSITGTALKANTVFDFEAKNSYSICVRVTDSANATFDQNFTITVTDVNEAPILDTSALNPIAQTGYERDNAKEVVYDYEHSLTWQDDAAAKTTMANWDDANTACENLDFAGYTDWYLPSIDELRSIVDTNANDPAIKSAFANSGTYYYWSSTVHASFGVTVVYFYDGSDSYRDKPTSNLFRCVRNGPLPTSTFSTSIAENQMAVFDFNATDADNDTLAFSIGGTDSALFEINATTGVLSFITAPDYENAQDANADNTYELNVSVKDASAEHNITLHVNITDVYESSSSAPSSSSASSSSSTPSSSSSSTPASSSSSVAPSSSSSSSETVVISSSSSSEASSSSSVAPSSSSESSSSVASSSSSSVASSIASSSSSGFSTEVEIENGSSSSVTVTVTLQGGTQEGTTSSGSAYLIVETYNGDKNAVEAAASSQGNPIEPQEELVLVTIDSSSGRSDAYSQSVTFTIPEGQNAWFTGFMKYGKELGSSDSEHWFDFGTLAANNAGANPFRVGTGYTIGAGGKTITITLADNQAGDNNPASGTIEDPAALIVSTDPRAAGSVAVPLFAPLGYALIIALFGLVAARRMRG